MIDYESGEFDEEDFKESLELLLDELKFYGVKAYISKTPKGSEIIDLEYIKLDQVFSFYLSTLQIEACLDENKKLDFNVTPYVAMNRIVRFINAYPKETIKLLHFNKDVQANSMQS